jgi:hypothetical protein
VGVPEQRSRSLRRADKSPVGCGVDDLGREFEVGLDANLAAEISTALEAGRRPIVAVEGGRSIAPALAVNQEAACRQT